MGQWGVKSYENDAAFDALDAALELVHGAAYEALMDDRNPLSVEQIQQRLANPATLAAALQALAADHGDDPLSWDEAAHLAFAGIIVRHAELRVPVPPALLDQARAALENEAIEWHEATQRTLRRRAELDLLARTRAGAGD